MVNFPNYFIFFSLVSIKTPKEITCKYPLTETVMKKKNYTSCPLEVDHEVRNNTVEHCLQSNIRELHEALLMIKGGDLLEVFIQNKIEIFAILLISIISNLDLHPCEGLFL